MKQRKSNFYVVIVFAWAASISINLFAQTDAPQWKLKEGDQFAVTLNQTSNSITNVDAREITVENSTIIEMDWAVTKVSSAGDATIEQALTRVKLSVNGFARVKKGERATPLKDIAFDTANPDDATRDSKKLLKQIQPLLGLKFSVVMGANGEIKDVSVSKNASAQLDKMPEARNLQRLFSDEGWKELLGASAIVLPDDLATGKEWTDESNITSPLGQLNRRRTYTYRGPSDDVKSVGKFELTVDLVPVESEATADVLKSKLIEFSGSGELLMDLDGGFLKSSTVKNKTTSEKPYREKMISTTISNEIETTIEKK